MGGTSERGLSRPAKAVLAAVLLGGLLAVVALAARGRHPGGHATLHQREVPTWLQNDLLTILLIVYALGIVVLIAAFLLVRKNWEEPPSQRRLLRNLVLAVVFVGALAMLAQHRLFPQHGKGLKHQPRSTSVMSATGRNQTVTSSTAGARRADIDWVLAGAVGGALLLTAVVVFARRRRVDEEEGETVEEELAAVVSDTIDDLRNEADPRRAVIAAYARMEGVLAQHGFARHRSEAPHEYLGRVLTRLRVRRGAVEELTELFERAKFSTHEIDPSMKDRAIAALLTVREDLQAREAELEAAPA